MRLIIITQKIDLNDDILGFIHGWVEKLSQKLDKLYVICLSEGEHHLPQNVEVFSLGKEKGYSKLRQLFILWKILFKKLPESDGVFAHMCPIYAISACPLAKIFGKKIILWYTHYKTSFLLKIASFCVGGIATSVESSCKITTRKLKVLGHGIDVEKFKPEVSGYKNKEIKLLFLGRITPVKNLEVLIEALPILKEKNSSPFILNIVGEPSLEKYRGYFKKIKERVGELNLEGRVHFLGRVPYRETPEIYRKHDIFINLTASYSFDKTILEAMASGLMVLVSNLAFDKIFPSNLQSILMFKEKDPRDLAGKIIFLMSLDNPEREKIGQELREIVVKNHNLENLTDKIISLYATPAEK